MKFLPELHIEFERWKYHMPLDIYVSTMGRIKNSKGEIQTVCKKDGYLYYKGKLVHRIVMQTWKPTPGYAWLTVDHKNHNTWDNRLSNLEWVTAEENKARDKADHEAHSPITAPMSAEKKESLGYILLDGAKIEITAARTILRNDKSLQSEGCQKQIDKAFKNIENGATEAKYGNHILKKVA